MATITTFSILLDRVAVLTNPDLLTETNTKLKSAGRHRLLVTLYVAQLYF